MLVDAGAKPDLGHNALARGAGRLGVTTRGGFVRSRPGLCVAAPHRRRTRVYEITGPAAWARLVGAYPLQVTASRRGDWYDTTGEYRDWFVPDWPAVAADFDAVHLTVHGHLTTPGNAIPVVGRRGSTVLAGWDPDATSWLRDECISVENEPMEWRRTSESSWHASWNPHLPAE